MNITNASAMLLNGRELKSLKIGGSLVWDASALTILSCPVGTDVYIEETEGTYVPYIIIAHGHHGAELVTLIRKYATDSTTRFHSKTPSGTANHKFAGSTLEQSLTQMFDAMPAATQAKIALVGVPTRSSAFISFTIDEVPGRLFPLSEMEYTGSGTAEGSHISYFDHDSKRIAYLETGAARITWTRTVSGGMETHARVVMTVGNIGNQTVTSPLSLRPALCLPFSTRVTEVDGKLQI